MANSDIIKIGFDYRASLAQFEKETNGVFDGISNKAGKQKITIQLDAKDDKVIDKIKELQKLKLDKFTFEFGDSGLKEQLQTFDKLETKINEIINLGKGKSFIDSSSITADIDKIENKINELNKKINTSFDTKNKTEAYNQLKKYADAFKDYYNNEEAMASESGTKAAYAYYKAYEEALKKEVAQSKLEKVTVDFDINDKFFDKNRIVSDRIKEYANYKKYGNDNDLLEEISSLKNKLFDFNSAYSQVKEKLGQAAITPEIIKSVERYVELLDKARFLEQLNDPDDNDTIKSHRAMAQASLDDALFNAQEQSYKYTKSLRQQEEQLTSTVEAEQKLAEVQKETTSNSVTSDNSQIEELKSDIQEVKTELGDVKDRISSIESNGFENVREDVEKTKESVKELNSELTEIKSNLSSTPQESNISSGMKDAFPSTEATADTKSEIDGMEQVEKTIKEAVQAKKDFATANEGVQSSIDGSKSPLQLEAELMDQIAKSAREAADAKKEFVEANNKVKDSANKSNNDLNNGHSENAEPSGVKKYKKKGYKAHDTGNHDNEKKVSNKAELGQALKDLQSEIIASIDKSTSFVKEVTDFYDSQDNLVKTQMKVGDKNGGMRTYTTSYSMNKDGNATAWTSHIETQKIAEQAKQEASNIQAEWDKNLKAIQDYMDSMTKLNNLKAKDKGTGSEANQIALQTQNVEKLKQAAWDARQNLSSMQAENPDIITWKQWVDMMKLFDQSSKGSAESAAKLKDVLNNIKAPSLDKYENKLSSYLNKTGGYNATIARFNDGGWTSDIYLKNVQAVKDAVKQYEDLLSDIKAKGGIASEDDIQKLKEYESEIKNTIATVTNMSAAEKGYNFVSGQKELDKIHKLLNENSKMSSEAKAKIRAYYAEIESGNPSMSLDKIHGEILKIYNAEVEAGRAGRTLWDTLKNSGFHQIAAQMAGMFGVYDIINIFKQGANTLKEFDDGLTKISYTMDMTKSQLDNLGNSVLDMASNMKSSIDDAMQVAQIYANMQTSAEEIQRLSEPTLILSNLSGFDSSTIADDIQAVTQQFDILAEDSMHIADVYDYISRNIAVDYSKGLNAMAEGLQVAGSTAKQAGLSYEQTASIIAKAVEKTRLEGSQVGNGLKTIMTRLSKVGELSEEVDNETLSQASESLKKVGIEVYNLDGSYREFDVIMGELAGKWDDLTDAEKSNISFNIAATRQTNLLSAVLSNFSDSMQLAEEATNANGSALENQQKYMESFSGHLQSLETEAKIAWLNILDSETLKDGVDLLTGLVKVTGQLVDTFGLLGTAAGIGGIVAGFKNVGIDTLVAY